MAITTFRPVTWQPMELIDEDKMDLMAQNQQYLAENMPRMLYRGFGIRKNDGIKVAAGLVVIPASKNAVNSNDVRFGNFFAPGCNPIVTTGIVSAQQRALFVTITGLGTTRPDQRGFRAHARVYAENKKNRKITRNFYVTWQALGY